jgi:hypothetical protein
MSTMQHAVLPNFFIVGTGKAGTTSLYHYLRQHPQIYMSPVKEPSYFASEIRVENLGEPYLRHIRRSSTRLSECLADGRPARPKGWLFSEWDEYLRLFQDVKSEIAIGEASVAYLWSESAAANIAARAPGAKIVMMLRDPSERAFSQYYHQLSAGVIHSTFREHIDNCIRYTGGKLGAYYPLLEVGLYYEQVIRYLRLFPKENIRIYWYEQAWRRPDVLLSDLFDFLGADSSFRPDMSRRSLERRSPRSPAGNYFFKRFDVTHRIRESLPSWLRRSIHKSLFRPGHNLKMDPKDRQILVEYYREDTLKLGSLLDRDLSAWLH